MNPEKIIIYLAVVGWFYQLPGQPINLNRVISPFPVYDLQNNQYELSFTGGINKPVIQFLDIDADGDPDLFILDQDQPDQLSFFRNTGTSSSFQYEWISDNFQDLAVGSWFKFVDIDNDLDHDLFAENPFGNIRFYRNT